MANFITINGRLTAPNQIELDEPVQEIKGEVEVTLRARPNGGASTGSVLDSLKRLPPGTRSREEIDQQLQSERDAWGD